MPGLGEEATQAENSGLLQLLVMLGDAEPVQENHVPCWRRNNN